jgi:hypothetical protein
VNPWDMPRPLVPWTRWPRGSRDELALEVELGARAAWCLIMEPWLAILQPSIMGYRRVSERRFEHG